MVTKVVVVIGVGTFKRSPMSFCLSVKYFGPKIFGYEMYHTSIFSSVARLFLKKQEAVLRNRIEREAIARYWDPRNHPPSPFPV